MATLIKGEQLTTRQREQVLAAYVHRHLSGMTDDAWIAAHAFYFINDGSRLAANRHHCEPHYLAD